MKGEQDYECGGCGRIGYSESVDDLCADSGWTGVTALRCPGCGGGRAERRLLGLRDGVYIVCIALLAILLVGALSGRL